MQPDVIFSRACIVFAAHLHGERLAAFVIAVDAEQFHQVDNGSAPVEAVRAGHLIEVILDIDHRFRLFLDDRRIGDAIYRLMYDTPQITEVCYRIILTPIVTPLLFVATVLVMGTTFDSTPVVWVPALVLLPVGLVVTVPEKQA